MAIVLPDAILGAPGLAYVRQWIVMNCRIVGSVDLHPDTFQPRNGTQTSVLVLQRKTDEDLRREARQSRINDYEIFMAQVTAIGHDKRGNNVYIRDKDGEEILFGPDEHEVSILERTSAGTAYARHMPKRKRLSDDTPKVAEEFLEWKEQIVLGW